MLAVPQHDGRPLAGITCRQAGMPFFTVLKRAKGVMIGCYVSALTLHLATQASGEQS